MERQKKRQNIVVLRVLLLCSELKNGANDQPVRRKLRAALRVARTLSILRALCGGAWGASADLAENSYTGFPMGGAATASY